MGDRFGRKKERLDYFDIFKFILIVSVVAGHSEIPYWLKTLIFSIHMPAFIIVNGYFMKPSGICEHMAKTGRSLIPVYFITVAALNLPQFICSCRIGTGLGLQEVWACHSFRSWTANILYRIFWLRRPVPLVF